MGFVVFYVIKWIRYNVWNGIFIYGKRKKIECIIFEDIVLCIEIVFFYV